jgi:hypothetical protein
MCRSAGSGRTTCFSLGCGSLIHCRSVWVCIDLGGSYLACSGVDFGFVVYLFGSCGDRVCPCSCVSGFEHLKFNTSPENGLQRSLSLLQWMCASEITIAVHVCESADIRRCLTQLLVFLFIIQCLCAIENGQKQLRRYRYPLTRALARNSAFVKPQCPSNL